MRPDSTDTLILRPGLVAKVCGSAPGAHQHCWRIAGNTGHHQRWPAPRPHQLMGLVALHPNCRLPAIRPRHLQHLRQRPSRRF